MLPSGVEPLSSKYPEAVGGGDMRVEVRWSYAGEGEENLEFSGVLYAYVHPTTREVLYVGEATYAGVRERFNGWSKEALLAQIQAAEGLPVVHAIVGVPWLPAGERYSRAMLAAVQSFLILKMRPRYNVLDPLPPLPPPELRVACRGDWPARRKRASRRG